MKPVMYHYVRPAAEGLPHFPYLSLAAFERQLDLFGGTFGFVSRDAFLHWVQGGPSPSGVLLTFDDGLRDHADFVLPALEKRGLFGLFYVASGPATTGRILDVHKVHLVVGRWGGPAVLAWIEANAPDLCLRVKAADGEARHYTHQELDTATKLVKQLFNWQMSAEERGPILDELLDRAFAGTPPRWDDIYLDEQGLRALTGAGMGVGPHSHTHEVASGLPIGKQRDEVELSCALVERVGGSRQWGYCYPHGLRSSFSRETERIVAEAGCPFAFAVEALDIATPLAGADRYALPRHNCNAFQHGAVSWGSEPEGGSRPRV